MIDLCSRRLAGWAIVDHMRTELVIDALRASERTRGSLAGAVMHTDHGSQGGFNWSSQHLLITEVCDGTTEEAAAGGAIGCAAAVGRGRSDAAADAFTGPA
ncbi:DDE-type integrase/transposase/recombinase [Streptomyces sp. A5-4]|uniref:DDE-type integrase/transposase/recombinase n=1 Tax=Streptomyces sp. A5-4 TaxID=3384771 RepID=UPI003DA9BC32